MSSRIRDKFTGAGAWWLLAPVLLLSRCGVYAGLADLDYYWQADLGSDVLSGLGFNTAVGLVWEGAGLGEYLNHEWLFCIVLSLFRSLFGDWGVFALKAFICLLTGVCTARFLKRFDLLGGSVSRGIFILLCVFLNAMVFVKVKAYSLSVLFLMEELVLLQDWRDSSSKRERMLVFDRMLLLCIVWNNVHSGSVPLFFFFAAVWLDWQLEEILCGVTCAVSLLVNPYGYKLLLFDMFHASDKWMRAVNGDWASVDAKTVLGVICAFLLASAFVLLIFDTGRRFRIIVSVTVVFFLSMSSARHCIYLFPFLYLATSGCCLFDKTDKVLARAFIGVRLIIVFVSLMFSVMGFVSGIIQAKSEGYRMWYVCDGLVFAMKEAGFTPDSRLFTDPDVVYLKALRYQDFTVGAYPLVANRVLDSDVLLSYGGEAQISQIIDFYAFDGYVFCKWNLKVPYYDVESPLYAYLVHQGYEKVYDDGWLVCFSNKKGD